MKLQPLVTASILLLTGCTSSVRPAPGAFVPLAYGSIDGFDALVPTYEGGHRCVTPANARVAPGGRAVSLVYPGPAERQVTVYLDAAGDPTGYVDARGDLSGANDRGGDVTMIGLYLDQGYAVLSNRPAGGMPTIVEIPLDQALESERLGNPTATLQRVLHLCDGAV